MSLARCSSLLGRQSRIWLLKRNKFYITLPEFPEGHVVNENLMPTANTLPEFKNIDPVSCYFDMGKECLKYDDNFEQFLNHYTDEDAVAYDNLKNQPVNEIAASLDKIRLPLYSLLGVMHLLTYSQKDFSNALYQKMSSRVSHSLSSFNSNKRVHDRLRRNPRLDDSDKRFVERFFEDSAFLGMELKKDELMRLVNLRQKIDLEKKIYLHNLESSKSLFEYKILHFDEMMEFPKEIRYAMCEPGKDPNRGPWSFTIHEAFYHNFFKYNSNESSRHDCWHALITTSTQISNKVFDNVPSIESLRLNRQKMAKLYGNKKGYSDLMLKHHLNITAEQALSVVEELNKNVFPLYEKAIDEIEGKAATKQKRDLQMCDIPYWRRQLKIDLYGDVEKNITSYLPFDHVWERTLDWFSKLFDIKFVKVNEDISTWDPDVEFYSVQDSDGSTIGYFYFDPYRQAVSHRIVDNANNILVRPRCPSEGSLPVSALMGGFKDGGNSLITLNTLKDLLSSFGTMLQDMIPKNAYMDLNRASSMGLSGMFVSSIFFQNWVKNPEFIRHIGKHYKTGEELSEVDANKVCDSEKHFAAIDISHQLFKTHLDLIFNGPSTKLSSAIYKDLWPSYHPLPYFAENYQFASDASLHAGPYAGLHFLGLYNQAIAADAYRAFEETPAEIQSLGKSYRETFLDIGAGAPVTDLFEKFRQRQLDFLHFNTIHDINSSQ